MGSPRLFLLRIPYEVTKGCGWVHFQGFFLHLLTWHLGWEQANSWEWGEAGKVWAPGHLLLWTLHMMPQVATPLPSRLKGQSKCTMENGKLLVFSRPTSTIMHPCLYYILFIKTVLEPCSRSRAGDRHCLLVRS